MKKIKTICNDDAAEIEDIMNAWIEEENPDIISITTIPDNSSSLPIIIVLYDDGIVGFDDTNKLKL